MKQADQFFSGHSVSGAGHKGNGVGQIYTTTSPWNSCCKWIQKYSLTKPMLDQLPTAPHERRVYEAFLTLTDLNRTEKHVLQLRYLSVSHRLRKRARIYSWLFHCGRVLVTVGSLIVPALLNIQGENGSNKSVYWFVWVLSLLVTTCNAIMTLFKVDKKYYFLHTILEQLQSEAWQYISLTGRYAQKGEDTNGVKYDKNHKELFYYFTYIMEKMVMKQVEEEYFKLLHDSDVQKDGKMEGKQQVNVLTPFEHPIVDHSVHEGESVRDKARNELGLRNGGNAGFLDDDELIQAASVGNGEKTIQTIQENNQKDTDEIQVNQNGENTAIQGKPRVQIYIPENLQEKKTASTGAPKTLQPFWRTSGRTKNTQIGSEGR